MLPVRVFHNPSPIETMHHPRLFVFFPLFYETQIGAAGIEYTSVSLTLHVFEYVTVDNRCA